jgi:hypothetical protein
MTREEVLVKGDENQTLVYSLSKANEKITLVESENLTMDIEIKRCKK